MFRTTLLSLLSAAPLLAQGLPPVPFPPENPFTPQKAVLGKILFWDEQLGSDDTVACGTCHLPGQAGGDPRMSRHPGVDQTFYTADDSFGSAGVVRADAGNAFTPSPLFGFKRQSTNRQAPTFFGVGYAPELFWDGRAPDTFTDPMTLAVKIPFGGALESQLVGPPVNDVEMAHTGRTWSQIVQKLQTVRPLRLATNLPADITAALAANPTYPALFQAAFGTPVIDSERVAFAIATYERALVPDQTPFDRGVMTPSQVAGFNVFLNQGACATECHELPHFTTFFFRNNGLRPPAEDMGRFLVTNNSSDRGRFKIPGLRNVGLRRRFMHNGVMTTLDQVVQFYNRGGDSADNRDPRVRPLGLTPAEISQLVDFLRNGLTDPRVQAETAPFDRPTLWSENHPIGGNLYGTESQGSGGLAPQMLAHLPAHRGNAAFHLGVFQGLGPSFGILGLSPLSAALMVNGIPLNIDVVVVPPILLALPLVGSGAGAGHATLALPLPNDPALNGDLFAQWFVVDAGTPSLLTGTFGARLTLF